MRASMSTFLPAPLTIVVLSFSIATFLARLSLASVTLSSFIPRSSEIDCPPVRTAMSCNIAFAGRRIRAPSPRRLEAAEQLVDHKRGERLALDLLGNDDQGF